MTQRVTFTSKGVISDKFKIQKGDAVWLTPPEGWGGKPSTTDVVKVFEGSLVEVNDKKVAPTCLL